MRNQPSKSIALIAVDIEREHERDRFVADQPSVRISTQRLLAPDNPARGDPLQKPDRSPATKKVWTHREPVGQTNTFQLQYRGRYAKGAKRGTASRIHGCLPMSATRFPASVRFRGELGRVPKRMNIANSFGV